jgi:hypothetical protein
MRAQMIAYYEQRHGAGLSDLARSAVALLAAGGSGPAASAPPSAGPASGAPPQGTKA